MTTDSVYHAVARPAVPVLLVWGTADKTVPFERSASVRAGDPRRRVPPDRRSGHLPILEKAQFTDSLILAFLARQPRERRAVGERSQDAVNVG